MSELKELEVKLRHNTKMDLSLLRSYTLKDAERRQRVHQEVIVAKCLVEICVLIFNYLGIPRSGKTTLRRRIMEEIVNIIEAGEIEQPSTGVVEDGGQVLLTRTEVGAITSSKVWTVFKDGDEANILSQLMHQVANQLSAKLPGVVGAKVTESSVGAKATGSSVGVKATESSVGAEASVYSGEKPPSANANEDEDMLSIIVDALDSDNWEKVKCVLEDITFITNNDAGGHAEFLDLQAALFLGPSFNLFFSRLQDKLDQVFEISYTDRKGHSTAEGDSTVTVEEALFQALASIACFGRCSFEDNDMELRETSERRQELSEKSTSKVMFVCTHLDKIENEEEREKAFKEKDKLLQKHIEKTKFYKEKVIKYVSEDQLMIKANNLNGDKKEVKEIQNILMKVIDQNFNNRIKIPASWLVLSLYLRKNFATISLRECERIAGKLRINTKKLQDVLWFLHYRVGVLLYYPEVEAMKDIVICKRQVVFDSASKLIRDTFTNAKVGNECWKKFHKKGQFSYKDMQAVMETAKEATPGHTDSLIPLDKLVALFQHRNILAPISTSPSLEETTYFMPCVLPSARKEELMVPTGSADPPPLMLCYDCGYMPLGVFPALITNLVSQQQWTLNEDCLFKNKVQFFVENDYDKVTLISHPCYFEIAITRSKGSKKRNEELCPVIRADFESTLEKVTSRMNHRFSMGYKFAFECPTHPGRDHLCTRDDKNQERMWCACEGAGKKESLPLEECHMLWFPWPSSGLPKDCKSESTAHPERDYDENADPISYQDPKGNIPICTERHHMLLSPWLTSGGALLAALVCLVAVASFFIVPILFYKDSGAFCTEIVSDKDLEKILEQVSTPYDRMCSHLDISSSSCNRLTHSGNLDTFNIAREYVQQAFKSCWEDIVRHLCEDFSNKRLAQQVCDEHYIPCSKYCS